MNPRKGMLRPLTALRFFAAAIVVIGHGHSLFGSFNIANAIATGAAVSFFFVLSGFILAYNYPVLQTGKDTAMFYATRFARIWPLHVVLAVCFLLVFQARPPLWHIGLNVALLQAWVPLHDVLLSLNGVSWSLSVEVFFYACFPLLIWRWRETWHWKLLIAAAFVVVFIAIGNIFALSWEDDASGIGMLGLLYMNPLVRLFEFLLGICGASMYRAVSAYELPWSRLQATIVEIIVVVVVVLTLRFSVSISQELWIGSAGRYYMFREGAALSFACLVVVFALERGALSQTLSHPVAIRLGEISFALYLVHTMVLMYFERHAPRISPQYLWLWFVGYWAVCLALSNAMFVGIEQPARAIILGVAKRFILGKNLPGFSLVLPMVKPMAFAGTILVGTVGAVLVFTPIDRANAVQQRPISDGTPVQATFGQKFALEKFRICSIDASTLEIAYALKPLAKSEFAGEVMAIHLIDATGKLMAGLDHQIDDGSGRFTENSSLYRRIPFPASKLSGIDQIGLAMYVDARNLFAIESQATTDWDGKRLILRVPERIQKCAD